MNKYQKLLSLIFYTIILCICSFCLFDFYSWNLKPDESVKYQIIAKYSPTDLIVHKHSADLTIVHKMDLKRMDGYILTKEVSSDTYYKNKIGDFVYFKEDRPPISHKYNIVISIIITIIAFSSTVIIVIGTIFLMIYYSGEFYKYLGTLK